MTEQTENRMLQNILLDAAASEFSEELSDSQPVVMSLRFQKQMEAMLKDPNGWAKRRERPIWKRFLQTVASIVLVCSLSLGALMAASPTVRAAVVNWMLKWYETYVVYRFFEEPVEDQLLPMPEYQITKLPNGYSEDGDLLELPNDTEIKYRNESGERIHFEYMRMHQGRTLMARTENMVVSDITVNGCPGQLYVSTDPEQSNALIWIDEANGLQFIIDGFANETDLMQMAESVTLYNSTK